MRSSNADLQLEWARDALQYCDISAKHEERISYYEGARARTPKVEHELREDAIRIVNFLADQTHPLAEFMRGKWLEFGSLGFRMDRKEAFRSYARSAERGHPRAEYRLGMQYENVGEHLKAVSHYQKGAAMDDSASKYRLGMLSIFGQLGQVQDYARGVMLIRQAAEGADTDFPQAAYVYGMLLSKGLEGVSMPEAYLPYDVRAAMIYIERAAFLGFAKAQQKMGLAYELSQMGCDFDPALSLHYNALAARQDLPEAEMAISKWFLCGYDGIISKNEELAFTYAQRAAMSELPTAEFAMGYYFEIGMHVRVDLKMAQDWYKKAAAKGNQDAQQRIEGISRSKTLSRKDHEHVALAKIRSTHGSQKDSQPPPVRASPKVSPIITVQKPTIEMPDPADLPPANSGWEQVPYLEPQQSPTQPIRPPSIAPYPLDDGPPRAAPSSPYLDVRSGAGTPPYRPSSAFGLHPSIKPKPIPPPAASQSHWQTPPPTDNFDRRPPPVRPYPAADPAGYLSYGPPPAPHSQSQPQTRIPPAGQMPALATRARVPSAGYPVTPQSQPQSPIVFPQSRPNVLHHPAPVPSEGRPYPPARPHPQPQPQHQLQLQPPSGSNKLQRNNRHQPPQQQQQQQQQQQRQRTSSQPTHLRPPPSSSQSQPQLYSQSSSSHSESKSQGGSPSVLDNGYPTFRKSSTQQPLSQSRPSSSGGGTPSLAAPRPVAQAQKQGTPPPKPPKQPVPSQESLTASAPASRPGSKLQQQQQQQQEAPSHAPANLPGKGPKTFEEMGVPTGKPQGECVVM